MRSKLMTYCLLIWVAMSNCVEPYDFRSGEQARHLVVEGRITQLSEYNRLRISWSTRYGTASNGQPIDWAEVTIYDGQGNSTVLFSLGEGEYEIPEYFEGCIGETYYLEIKLNDKTYRSIPEKMPHVVEPESVTLDVGYKTTENEIGSVIKYPNIDVLVNTRINTGEEKQYLKWKVDEVFSFSELQCGPLHVPKTCFAQRDTDPDLINVFSGEQLGEVYLDQQFVAANRIYEPDWFEYVQTHFFNVYQYSITRESFEYWDKLSRIAQPEGNIFDLPPAAVRGNIYNVDDEDELVLGYFEASSVGIARTLTSPEDLRPFIIENKWRYCRNVRYCCDCLTIQNSFLEEPDYWR